MCVFFLFLSKKISHIHLYDHQCLSSIRVDDLYYFKHISICCCFHYVKLSNIFSDAFSTVVLFPQMEKYWTRQMEVSCFIYVAFITLWVNLWKELMELWRGVVESVQSPKLNEAISWVDGTSINLFKALFPGLTRDLYPKLIFPSSFNCWHRGGLDV